MTNRTEIESRNDFPRAWQWIDDRKITLRAVYQPQTLPLLRPASMAMLKWRCDLLQNDEIVIETPYSAGILAGSTVENKSLHPPMNLRTFQKLAEMYAGGPGAPRFERKTPLVIDVLYSLALDAGAVDMCWEDFADEYGLNPDSMADRETYLQCVKTGLALRAAKINAVEFVEIAQEEGY